MDASSTIGICGDRTSGATSRFVKGLALHRPTTATMAPKKGSKKKSTKAAPEKEPLPSPAAEEPAVATEENTQMDVEARPESEAVSTTAPTLNAVEAAGQAIKAVAEDAGEFIETMNGETSSASNEAALTMEERKAKMEQLRAKMVRSQHVILTLHTYSLNWYYLFLAHIIAGEPRLFD